MVQKIKKIFIGADHAGFALKEKVKKWLVTQKIAFEDCGDLVFNPDDDYPDFAAAVAHRVVKEKSIGIVFCGSAEGVCIAANKINGARAVNPHGIIQTKLARVHEDANVLCLAGGQSLKPQPAVSFQLATKMITIFLKTPFSNLARHKRRIAKIHKLEGVTK
ncbi:RpiB/LacA/LacB family sugar-phosphate isomerase [Candidatus Woesearchaeota archaeon]|nr:RpiB/LacA/LacB family sugar-phosphate isomerase [Candidatus Woesearchaeota archaeon]